MNKLKDKYPLAIIPMDTLLFRAAPNNNYYDSMFFSFDYYGTSSSEFHNAPIQTWVTKKPIISRLIVKGMKSAHVYKTDLEYCYYTFCDEWEYDLYIKNRKNPKFESFLNFLRQNEIDSWVGSIENKIPMELHLFSINNNNLIKFKQYIDPEKNKGLMNKKTFKKVILLDANTAKFPKIPSLKLYGDCCTPTT